MSRFPVVFRLPAFASWPSCARWGVGLPLRSAYRASAPGPQRGRRVPHERDAAGVGAPYTPGLRCSPDRLGVLRSAPPLPSGQSWTPLQQPICGASDDEASTGVYLRSPVRPSSSPVAPGWNGSPWACNLSFAPRRHKPTTHVRPGTGHRALARSCTFDFNCQSTSNGQLTRATSRRSPPSDYYADSATPRAHQPASGLAGPPPAARRARGASHVHHDPFDRVGSWLYPYSPAGGHSQSPAGHHARTKQPDAERAAVKQSGIVAVDDPDPPGFGSLKESRGFYHQIALALPFGLASTHAGVWRYRPAVALSGTLDLRRAIPRLGRPQLLRAAASARGQHSSRHG